MTEADYLVGVLTEDEQFTYDSLGNRTNVNRRNGTDEVYSLANPNLNNEYTTIGGNSLTHDNAGNMTGCNLDYTYEYDYENRLNKITKNSVTKAEYVYDALGRRIEKIGGGVTTRYYYDGWRVLSEIEGVSPNEEQRDFVYGNYLDEVLIMIDPSGNDHYYAHDHLYSPVALIADNGTVEERYEYDAYGKCTIWDATFTNTRSTSLYDNDRYFTGQMLDALDNNALFIMYYKNRYYLVDLGRFMQADPLGIRDGICIIEFTDSGVPHFPRKNNATYQYIDGMNLFEYVRGNPVGNFDIYGLFIGISSRKCCSKDCGGTTMYRVHQNICGCPKGWRRERMSKCFCVTNANRIYSGAIRDAANSDVPGKGHNDDKDAYRHCLASCRLARSQGAACAFIAGHVHEILHPNDQFEKESDLHNNKEGRNAAGDCRKRCDDACKEKLHDGDLNVVNGW